MSRLRNGTKSSKRVELLIAAGDELDVSDDLAAQLRAGGLVEVPNLEPEPADAAEVLDTPKPRKARVVKAKAKD